MVIAPRPDAQGVANDQPPNECEDIGKMQP